MWSEAQIREVAAHWRAVQLVMTQVGDRASVQLADGYATALEMVLGDESGQKTVEVICPECQAGKHRNCDGTAWSFERDERVLCQCDHG